MKTIVMVIVAGCIGILAPGALSQPLMGDLESEEFFCSGHVKDSGFEDGVGDVTVSFNVYL
jgi:hypothetical protein